MAIDVNAWYEKYGPIVIRRCRVLLRSDEDAMDAVQDVFLNILKARGRLKDSYPSSLLYTIATNVCLNRIRAKKKEKSDSLDGFFTDKGEGFFTDSGYEAVNAKLLLEEILEDESEETRTILFMYHADGMSLKEIGEVFGLSISGVKKRIDVFKYRTRQRLGEDFYE